MMCFSAVTAQSLLIAFEPLPDTQSRLLNITDAARAADCNAADVWACIYAHEVYFLIACTDYDVVGCIFAHDESCSMCIYIMHVVVYSLM